MPQDDQLEQERLAAHHRRYNLAPGTVIDGHRIERELARGNMGRVFVASDPMGRQVAFKVVLANRADPDGLARFQREGQAAAAVKPHRNVVSVHSLGAVRGAPYLVMDFVPGQTLKELIRERPLPPERAAFLAERLGRAIEHIHRFGVLHRDLKPANVIVRADDGEPVITDFGTAGLLGAERLTQTGDLLGTPLYMSPEQVLGMNDPDGRIDVWALGVILFEMLSGRPPFIGGSLVEVTAAITHDPLPDLRELVPGIDSELVGIVARATAKAPEDRYVTAGDLAAALRAWRGAPPSETGSQSTRGSRGSRGSQGTRGGGRPPLPDGRRRLRPALVLAVVIPTVIAGGMLAGGWLALELAGGREAPPPGDEDELAVTGDPSQEKGPELSLAAAGVVGALERAIEQGKQEEALRVVEQRLTAEVLAAPEGARRLAQAQAAVGATAFELAPAGEAGEAGGPGQAADVTDLRRLGRWLVLHGALAGFRGLEAWVPADGTSEARLLRRILDWLIKHGDRTTEDLSGETAVIEGLAASRLRPGRLDLRRVADGLWLSRQLRNQAQGMAAPKETLEGNWRRCLAALVRLDAALQANHVAGTGVHPVRRSGREEEPWEQYVELRAQLGQASRSGDTSGVRQSAAQDLLDLVLPEDCGLGPVSRARGLAAVVLIGQLKTVSPEELLAAAELAERLDPSPWSALALAQARVGPEGRLARPAALESARLAWQRFVDGEHRGRPATEFDQPAFRGGWLRAAAFTGDDESVLEACRQYEDYSPVAALRSLLRVWQELYDREAFDRTRLLLEQILAIEPKALGDGTDRRLGPSDYDPDGLRVFVGELVVEQALIELREERPAAARTLLASQLGHPRWETSRRASQRLDARFNRRLSSLEERFAAALAQLVTALTKAGAAEQVEGLLERARGRDPLDAEAFQELERAGAQAPGQ